MDAMVGGAFPWRMSWSLRTVWAGSSSQRGSLAALPPWKSRPWSSNPSAGGASNRSLSAATQVGRTPYAAMRRLCVGPEGNYVEGKPQGTAEPRDNRKGSRRRPTEGILYRRGRSTLPPLTGRLPAQSVLDGCAVIPSPGEGDRPSPPRFRRRNFIGVAMTSRCFFSRHCGKPEKLVFLTHVGQAKNPDLHECRGKSVHSLVSLPHKWKSFRHARSPEEALAWMRTATRGSSWFTTG